MNIYKTYSKILGKEDNYSTDSSAKRRSILPLQLRLIIMILAVVIKANRKVKAGLYDLYNWVGSSLETLIGLEKIGFRFDIQGMDNLNRFEGPAVFISNHMSTLETFILPLILGPRKPLTFVIKKQLADFPLFGPVVMSQNPIVVGRENPREDLQIVLEEGSKLLKSGVSIVLFPQKTRSQFFDAESFNSLGVKLAKRNNVPVVPVALVTDAWGNGKLVRDFGKVDISKDVHFCLDTPLKVEATGTKEHEYIIEFIKNKLTEWGREDLIK